MASARDFDVSFRVAVLGRDSSGKTSVVLRLKNHPPPIKTTPTSGAEITSHLDIYKDVSALLEIWDISKEKIENLISVYLRSIDAVLYVYDVTSRESFEHIRSCSIPCVESHATWRKRDQLSILVGTKCDLKTPVVSAEEARSLAEAHHISHVISMSGATGEDTPKLRAALYHALCEPSLKKPDDVRVRSACRNGDLEALSKILQSTTRRHFPTNRGWTLLHIAAARGHTEVARYLIGLGATVNGMAGFEGTVSGGECGATPLHAAALASRQDMLRLLLLNNADPSILDCDSNTAADLADSECRAVFARYDTAQLLRAKARLTLGASLFISFCVIIVSLFPQQLIFTL